jgi:outer membrane protein OmpA-like peptidoglycan-associated protein
LPKISNTAICSRISVVRDLATSCQTDVHYFMKINPTQTSTKTLALLLTVSLLTGDVLSGCKSIKRNSNRAQRGTVIGAGSGAVIGGVIGRQAGNTAVGAILGAVVGGAAGAVIGRRMDKQAEEIRRELPDAQVERVGEGIKITLGSDILFDVNSATLKPATQKSLSEFARILNKNPGTQLVIEGHADATGPHDYNVTLSKRRAKAVSAYLRAQGVTGGRLDEKGYGEDQPVAENDSESGRSKNRRVDIAVFAGDKMKRDAKNGTLE